MTDHSDASVDDRRATLAAAFGGEIDPLASHAATFEGLDVDPFALFLTEALDPQEPAEDTRTAYERLFRQWREHMAREGRHPTCPNEQHVQSFVRYCRTVRDNQPDTVRTKLRRLNKAYEYWQQDPVFPHPGEFNPFLLVLSKLDLERPPIKKPPRIPIEELADKIRPVTHIRDRAILVVQLKLGLRASEVSNLRLEDVHVEHPDLRRTYPDLGSQSLLADRPNAVYIPSRYERDKNKSRRPRVLPLDEELQQVLVAHLITRPETGTGWVFHTKSTHNKLRQEPINAVWRDVFRPEYAETEAHRGVTSHFGRHRFTTYWQVEQDVNRELVKYMRGDNIEGNLAEQEVIDHYIHTYYEDIEQLYRERIFDLGAAPSGMGPLLRPQSRPSDQ